MPSKRKSHGTWIMILMLVFAVTFVGLATWLGQERRHHYRDAIRPESSGPEAFSKHALGLAVSILPRTQSDWANSSLTRTLQSLEGSEDSRALFDRALILTVLNKSDLASELLASLDPDADIQALRALHLESRRAPAEDLTTAWNAVLKLDPNNANAHLRLGQLHFQAGLVRTALHHAESAARSAKDCADAHLLLGQLCLRVEDLGRAKQAFRQVLWLRPGDPEAQSAIRRIEGG